MSIQEQNTFILELKLLSKILRSSHLFDPDTLEILGERHLLLEKSILPLIPDNALTSVITEEKLTRAYASRAFFIHNLQDSFVENNQDFINHLKDLGLTKNEINYCCLLTLGFKGKEIGFFTNNPNHYNNSSTIRQKLGLNKNDTNLGLFLRNMFRKIKH